MFSDRNVNLSNGSGCDCGLWSVPQCPSQGSQVLDTEQIHREGKMRNVKCKKSKDSKSIILLRKDTYQL